MPLTLLQVKDAARRNAGFWYNWRTFDCLGKALSTENLLNEGFSLMLMGMGTVFVFLTILVFVTTIMSALVQKYSLEFATKPASKQRSTTERSPQDDQTLFAVITAAIHAHRRDKK